MSVTYLFLLEVQLVFHAMAYPAKQQLFWNEYPLNLLEYFLGQFDDLQANLVILRYEYRWVYRLPVLKIRK